jgi:gliding motility-associated-like protein
MLPLTAVKTLTIIVLLCLASRNDASANHIRGAEIYYNCISPLVYEVHLIVTTECATMLPGLPIEQGTAWSTSLGACISFNFDTAGVGVRQGKEASAVCVGIGSQCTNPSSIYPSSWVWHYKKNLSLPGAAKDWHFTWQSCCTSTSIVNTGAGNLAVVAQLNNLTRTTNNSPRFLIEPIQLAAINCSTALANAPWDPDFDSIKFTTTTPISTSNCLGNTYAPSYSAIPLASNPQPTLNSQTGIITFVPTQTGHYLLACECYDIDKSSGDTLGTCMRCHTLEVAQLYPWYCTNQIILSDTQSNAVFNVCAGNQICIKDTAVAPSTAALIVCSSNSNEVCPGSIFSHPSYSYGVMLTTLCWTPSQTDIGLHTVIIEYKDSTCTQSEPYISRAYKTIKINVLPSVSAEGSHSFCEFGDSLKLQAKGPASVTAWKWAILPGQGLPVNVSANFSNDTNANCYAAPDTTMYIVLTGLPQFSGGCSNTDTVLLTRHPQIVLSGPDDFTACAGEAIQLNMTASDTGGSWIWTPSTFLSTTLVPNPISVPYMSISYTATYKSLLGCFTSKQVEVNTTGTLPSLRARASKNIICPEQEVALLAYASTQPCGYSYKACDSIAVSTLVGQQQIWDDEVSPFAGTPYTAQRIQYMYTAAELNDAGVIPGNITSLSFTVENGSGSSNNNYLDSFAIKIGCADINGFTISNGPYSNLRAFYNASHYNPLDGENVYTYNAQTPYYWDGLSNLIVEVSYFAPQAANVVASSSGSYTEFASACLLAGNSNAPPQLLSNNIKIRRLRPNIKLWVCSQQHLDYSWEPASLLYTADQRLVQSKNLVVNTIFTVTASTASEVNCSATATVLVVVDTSTYVHAKASPAVVCKAGYSSLLATATEVDSSYHCGEQYYRSVEPTVEYKILEPNGAINSQASISNFLIQYGGRMQFIITASELQASIAQYGLPQEIKSLSLNIISKATTGSYRDLTIKLLCIPSSSNSLSSFVAEQMCTVFVPKDYTTILGNNTFTLDKPYLWNGSDNILIEICFANNPGSDTDELAATTYDFGMITPTYLQSSFSDPGCMIPLSANLSNSVSYNFRPELRLGLKQVLPKLPIFSWEPSLYLSDTTIANPTAYINQASTYTVTTLNNSGCAVRDTVQVRIVEHDVSIQPSSVESCPGDLSRLVVQSAGADKKPSYKWYPSINLNCDTCNVVYVNTDSSITYTVVRSDRFMCTDSSTVSIWAKPAPEVSISSSGATRLSFGDTITFTAVGSPAQYHWSPEGLSNPTSASITVNPASSMWYTVLATNDSLCTSSDSIWVDVHNNTPQLMPNAFSPNGDGLNDVFKTWSTQVQSYVSFRVYNRTGNLLYDGKGEYARWDGTFKGKDCVADTYFYAVELLMYNGNVAYQEGDLMLVR